MTADVRVSVIVCTRNRAPYLPDCLRSVACQDCGVPFEVLLIDNGSTDQTWPLITDWCLRDARFRGIQEPRLGLSVAKNTGVRQARGTLLLFTDDDVILDRGWIRSYVELFERVRNDSAIAGGPILPVPHDLGDWAPWLPPAALREIGTLDYCQERPLARHEYVWGANMAIPAGIFRRVGLWDETIGVRGDARGTFEDTDFQDRLRERGGVTWFCPAARLHHRLRRQQVEPARLLRNAFARGRNEFLREAWSREEHGISVRRHDYVRCLMRLGWHLCELAAWSLLFRFHPSQSFFARAHAAAWSSGSVMDLLRAGRWSGRTSSVIGAASLRMLGFALRPLGRRNRTG